MSCLGDRTEMAHSIEGRTPFLDHPLTEFVNSIPPSLKMRWKGGDEFTSKWILREACKDFVTPEVYNRAKHVSHAISLNYWKLCADLSVFAALYRTVVL